MQKILLLILLTSLLLAQNPKIYATLGDVIYNNSIKISKLKQIPSFIKYTDKINIYIADVNKTKKNGFSIILGDKGDERSEYLNKLRELSKINDFFVRSVKESYKSSIKNEDNKLFISMISSGLLNIEYFKKNIIDYYLAHKNDINTTVLINQLILEDSKLIKIRDMQKIKRLQQEQIQNTKIKRIRAKDLAEHEAIKKSLEADVAKKKAIILKEQKKELNK